MDLSIQIVNFRSRHYLKECLFSIVENIPSGTEAEIVVMNNDEKPLDDIFSEYEKKFPCHVIEISENIGFGRAHNIGFEKSRGEYVLFLNPDAKILPNSLEKLLSVIKEEERVGIVGPLLVDSAQKVDPDCFGAEKTPFSIVWKKTLLGNDEPQFGDRAIEVGWISGGAMLVLRDIFEKLGGFDENYFMYFEDVDLCRRAKRLDCKILVDPAARVLHESGKSFESEREKKKIYYISQDYYLKKHFGRMAAELVRLLRLPYYIKNVWLN